MLGTLWFDVCYEFTPEYWRLCTTKTWPYLNNVFVLALSSQEQRLLLMLHSHARGWLNHINITEYDQEVFSRHDNRRLSIHTLHEKPGWKYQKPLTNVCHMDHLIWWLLA
jgi:hypothetical protein